MSHGRYFQVANEFVKHDGKMDCYKNPNFRPKQLPMNNDLLVKDIELNGLKAVDCVIIGIFAKSVVFFWKIVAAHYFV